MPLDSGELALGIDIGTTNVKVVVLDSAGVTHAGAARPLTTTTDGATSTQDPTALWEAVVGAAREATDALGPAAEGIVAVGVCSQYSSIVAVDEHGNPLSPLLMWTDTRGTDHCWAIMERHPEAFATWVERHGIPTVGSGLSLAHLLHLQIDQPDLHRRTATYLEPMDYVVARLTGVRCATQASMFTAQLCDNRALDATTYDADLLAMSGVDPSRLPPIVALDAEIGTLQAPVAAELGVPASAVVWPGINDSQAAALATGAFGARRLGLMIGTTAVLLDTVGHAAADLDHEVVSMPGPIAGRYLVWAENGVAGRSVEQVATLLDLRMDQLDEILSEADSPSRVMFLPWLAGSLAPAANRAMRGGFLNLGLEDTRAGLLRSAVEGTARSLRWLLPHVTDFSGSEPDEIVFGGGAARSTGWSQALADILGVPIAVLDAPGFAAARAVGSLALCRRDGIDPLAAAPIVTRRHEPNAANAAFHTEMQQQFEAAFEATLPICQALNPLQ